MVHVFMLSKVLKCLYRFCDDFDLCLECNNKPRSETHPTDVPHIFIKMKKPRTSPAAMQRVLKDVSCCGKIVNYQDAWKLA